LGKNATSGEQRCESHFLSLLYFFSLLFWIC